MKIRTKLKGGQFHTTWWPASQITIHNHHNDLVVFSVPRWLASKEALNPNSIIPPLSANDKTILAQLGSRLFYIEERILDQAERRHGDHGKKADQLRAEIAQVRAKVDAQIESFPFPNDSIAMLNLDVNRIERAVKSLVNRHRPPSRDEEDEELKRPASASRSSKPQQRARR